jgi:hypothetical protein
MKTLLGRSVFLRTESLLVWVAIFWCNVDGMMMLGVCGMGVSPLLDFMSELGMDLGGTML